MQRFVWAIDRLNSGVGKAFAWCILVLTLAVSYEVGARYLLRAPTDWAYDTAYMLYGTLFMMAGAYTLARNGHVRGDVLYRYLSPRAQAGLDLCLYLVFFFPGVVALVYAGYEFAAASWAIRERVMSSPGGPPLYPFKTVIPLAGFLLCLQGLAEVARCVICLRTGAWPPRAHDVEELERAILEEVHEGKTRDEILRELHLGRGEGPPS
jgi:TRAP-type mannitol/chloroaromatic compound transport system permease small subunit